MRLVPDGSEQPAETGGLESPSLFADVGDGPTDVRTAQCAGVDLCLVAWGYPGAAAIEAGGERAERFDDVVRLVLGE